MEHSLESPSHTSPDTTHLAELPEMRASRGKGARLLDSTRAFHGVKVRVQAVVGQAVMSVGEISALEESAVVTLDRASDALIDIVLDGHIIARGQLVVVGEHFGVRVTETAPMEG